MNLLRNKLLNGHGSLALTLMAVIFVFSISFHCHDHEEGTGALALITDSDHDSEHSENDCFTCLIQANIKLPELGLGLGSPIPTVISALEESQNLPHTSYIKSDKPSRSPPAA